MEWKKPMENRETFLIGEERRVTSVSWPNPHWVGMLRKKKFTLKSNQIKVENSKDKKNILNVSVNKKQVTWDAISLTSHFSPSRMKILFLKENDMSQILNMPPLKLSIRDISEKSNTQNIYHPCSQFEHNYLKSFPEIWKGI